jgi:hypothetical protein
VIKGFGHEIFVDHKATDHLLMNPAILEEEIVIGSYSRAFWQCRG